MSISFHFKHGNIEIYFIIFHSFFRFAKLSKKSEAKEDFRETLKSVPDEDEVI